MRKAYRIVVGKCEGKGPLQISRRRWENDIKMELKEIGCEGVNWVHLAQDGEQ
jgi:hypothetical protein